MGVLGAPVECPCQGHEHVVGPILRSIQVDIKHDSHGSQGLAPIRVNWTLGLSVHSF